MTECSLAAAEISKLNRDLRLLIGTNGTLTRVLGIVAGEEIVVRIVNQKIGRLTPEQHRLMQSAGDRILQRRVLLEGRSSGRRFVAAESLVAIDLLPASITASLAETDCPIGEIIAGCRLETFKEPADVWIGEAPDWLVVNGLHTLQPKTAGRRYRVISGGRPVVIITEYFLETLESM